ncbi:MAG TPA: toll/interleukin-1 receptor domain-containing protein [Thermoanaerobaculia bacterium]|nr:toll/interleukin-1 receptor domain-containing protein [Thermoanaerobaculia bacterium]
MRLDHKTIFISYSHSDAKWLKRLQIHLKPLERHGEIVSWDDTKISSGSKWDLEIEKALRCSSAAILLVSADFLASDFITTHELLPLLAEAEHRGATILPIIVSPCRFEKTEMLSRFQAINPPSRPLTKMTRNGQEEVFVKVTEAVEKIFGS